MKRYYMSTTKEVIDMMGVDIDRGLLEYECELRRKQYGDNKIDLLVYTRKKWILSNLFKEVYLWVSIFAIILFILQRLNNLAFVTAGLLLFNVLLRLYWEKKKITDLGILYNLNISTVTVVREGVQRIIQSCDLVKGDVVVVKKGSFIGADMRIIESDKLVVDEKNITGEEVFKQKYETKIHNHINTLAEINNILFRGTLVREGMGRAIVVATGNETQLGVLFKELIESGINKNTLYQNIQKKYTKVFICLNLVLLTLYLILPSFKDMKGIIFSYGIFSILSISLPLFSMIYSKILIRDFRKEGIDIRNISSIDLVNKVKVIFLNKYENITESKLKVKKVYTNEEIVRYNNADSNNINIKRMIDISLLTNNCRYGIHSNWENGDNFEISYAEFGVEKRIFKTIVDSENIRKFELPVNSYKNMTTTLNKSKKGYRANSRGNIDKIISKCTYILINGLEREINSRDIDNIKNADLKLSKEGLITEAFAYRSFNYQPSQSENIESNMVFVGLMGHENPIREMAQEELKEIMEMGVLPILFTDENKISAEVLGRKIGLIVNSEQITTEVELELLSQKEKLSKISKTRIFCKLSSEYKNKIISLFEGDGFSLLTEGEVFRDIPILSKGTLSIARGRAITLLKNISDLYSNLSSLETFIKLSNRGKEVSNLIDSSINVYSLFILTEIIILNLYYILNHNIIFSHNIIILLNLFILTPVLILNTLVGKKINSVKYLVSNYILFISVAISVLFTMNSTIEVSLFSVLGIDLIVFVLFNSNINFKRLNRENKVLLICAIFFVINLCILLSITNTIVDKILLLKILSTIIIFILGEILLKKWQK